MFLKIFYLVLILQAKHILTEVPIVITTWDLINAADKAWEVLDSGGSALDAIEQGAKLCEEQQCQLTVGFGGSPDEHGETTLDAMLMDGKTMNVGAIGGLRRIKNVVSVARQVLDHSKHSFLAGDLATEFAIEMGFPEETLTTPVSKAMWMEWYNEKNCQPNYWTNVKPDPTKSCGPYTKDVVRSNDISHEINEYNHDTIGLVAVDSNGDVAAGTSTNGARFKIPGRVGDSPIVGAGAYADNAVGAAAATGDGDVMMRFLPSFLAVEEMRRGASPQEAADTAVSRISAHYPTFSGAVIVVHRDGRYGVACNTLNTFPYVVHDPTTGTSKLLHQECN